MVFDLGVGEGGALHRAPHHRLGAAIEAAAHQHLVELGHDGRLGGIVHRGVARAPVAEHAQALELAHLGLDPVGGVGAAAGAELAGGHLVLGLAGLADLLLDLPLDGQAVAVPARHVIDVVAEREARPHHEVLQQLVQRVADMDVAVGVGRPVVQHEEGRPRLLPRPARQVVEVGGLPAGEKFGLELGQARPHGEGRGRQKHRLAIIAHARLGRGGRGIVRHRGNSGPLERSQGGGEKRLPGVSGVGAPGSRRAADSPGLAYRGHGAGSSRASEPAPATGSAAGFDGFAHFFRGDRINVMVSRCFRRAARLRPLTVPKPWVFSRP